MTREKRRFEDVELLDDGPADGARPAGVTRHVRRPVTLAVVVVVGALAVAATAIGLTRMSSDQGTPIAVLDRAQRASDTLPDSGSDDLVASSSRRVASAGDATFWAARSTADQYCFVTEISGPAGGASSTCGSTTTLERGVVLSLNVGANAVTAALVADGAAAPSAPGSWTRLSDNVFLDLSQSNVQ